MSKTPKTYNLSNDVIKEISKKAKDDERKDSPWLDIFLRKQLKMGVKQKPKKDPVKSDDTIAGYVPCSNGQFEVMQSYVDTWSLAYPNVDIGAELNKIVSWLDSNPKKTVNGCKKFLNGWLNRAQNSAKSNNNYSKQGKTDGNLSACQEFLND